MEKHCLARLLDCPWAVRLYSTFQDDLSFYLHMEYVEGGELWSQARIFGIID
jgi:serine/threonine protein kinase